MSVVFLSNGEPTGKTIVTVDELKNIAAKFEVSVSPDEEGNYLQLLNGLDATARLIADLPAYIDPRLKPDPKTLPRTYWKEEGNSLNAWSHRCEIKHPDPLDGRLDGKTFAVKDNVSIAEIPLTGGTFPELLTGKREYPVPQIDAIVVKRMLESGATCYGSATCEHFSMSPLSFTSATGPVHNPWRKGYTTGGSSSGPGALIAITQVKNWRKRHGLQPVDKELGTGVDMCIGGDQGGSIRIPTSYCGIYGLKPTHGLTPYTGIISLHPLIDHTRPMAASLPDLATMLAVMAGWDGIDPRMTPESPTRENVKDYAGILKSWTSSKEGKGEWTSSKAGGGLRVGVVKESFEVLGLSNEVRQVISEAVEQFKAVGAAVSEVSIPAHHLGPSIWTLATRAGIGLYGLQNNPLPLLGYPMPDITPPRFNQKAYDILNKHNPATVNMVFAAEFLNSDPLRSQLSLKAMCHVTELRAAYDAALENYDVLVLPSNPTVGSKHPEYSMNVTEKMAPAIGGTLNTCQFNVTGHPALCMPAGFGSLSDGSGKMPVAMQLVAKRFDEESILKAAAAWEVGGLGLDKWDGK